MCDDDYSAAGVPSVGGKPPFRPSPLGTGMVAVAVLVATLVISGAIGWLGEVIPASVFRVLTLAMSLVLKRKQYVAIFPSHAVGVTVDSH
jgi:hypothetical protein